MEKEQEASNSSDRRNPSPKPKSQKLDYPVWDTGVSVSLEKIEFD
jgi:hypothetical protein